MSNNLFKMYDSFLASKIKIRIFFAFSFIFFALIITAITFIINYKYEENYLKKSIKIDAFDYINNKQVYLNNILHMHKHNLIALSHNQIFKDYIGQMKDKKSVVPLFEQVIKSHKNIMQLRYIDKNGMENIRLDRPSLGDDYYLVDDKKLQNKSSRYYFTETKKIFTKNKVWISDIDLNIENGKVQIPYVPTIRITVPIYDKEKFKGILIINLFMKNILNSMTSSKEFIVSLLDKNGDILIGKNEINGKVIDYSWSKYMLEKIDMSKFLPDTIDSILNSEIYFSDTLYSKNISKELDLIQNLILVLKIKQETIDEIKSNTISKLYDTLSLVLLISGPIGLLLALIPSTLANRFVKASNELTNKSYVFDEYLETMNMNNIISKSDKKGIITYVNDNFCYVSGYTKDELIGKPHSLLRHPSTPKETFKILWLTIQSGKPWMGMLRNKKKNGGYYDVDMVIMPIKNTHGKIVEYLAVRHEITELIEQRKNLFDIANTDQITGVGNRYKLNNDIKNNKVNNIAVIDIDKFSNINDLYGHKLGDIIIQEFAKLLEEHLTDEFELYRLHADKFAILNYTLDKERFTNYIEHLNNAMIESVIKTDIKDFDIVTTVGLSSQDNSIILSTAEMVNKHAKSIGKKVLNYSNDLELEKVFDENIRRTEEIKNALMHDRFEVYYQPIYNNHSQKIEKYESLIRMIDIEGNVISPFFFLDIAKSSGQYIDITKIVIEQSFKKFQNTNYEFSINLTIEDILNEDLVEYLENKIQQYNIGEQLVLEIVESEEIEEFTTVQKFIRHLKVYGIQIAIDDFGTGYSNFEYLIKLEPDYIKIDGSLIKEVHHNKHMHSIVTTIIDFAQKMGYKTIAEFVATEEVFSKVNELEIDYSQGYHLGKPQKELIDT